jgi:hypothetical protein
MAKQTKSTKGRSQDRKLVSNQQHEMQYESEKTGISISGIKRAKKSAGRSRKAVEKKLRSK